MTRAEQAAERLARMTGRRNLTLSLRELRGLVMELYRRPGAAPSVFAPVVEDLYNSRIIQFPAHAEDLAVGVLGARPGTCVGEAGEHGAPIAMRGKAVAGTAGVGTTTILIEADDNPAFSSAVTLFTLALDANTEVDDIVLDNPWADDDIWVRARCTVLGGTAPMDVNVEFFYKERAENF